MFLLLPLIRRLARHDKLWVVWACGAALLAGGIALVVVGFTAHVPAATRIGFVLLVAVIVFSVSAFRSRRSDAPLDQKGGTG